MNHRSHRSLPESFREAAVPAAELLELMKLGEDDTVVDVGAGSGYYSFLFASSCKEVLALDLYSQPEAKELASRAEKAGIKNLKVIPGDACNMLWTLSFTHAFFSNSFHDMGCRDDILSSIRNAGAKLTVVEFKPTTPFGPPSFIRIPKTELERLAEAHGFSKLGEKDFKFHYALSFRPSPRIV
ncbi:MAG: class I SAM-dependent methyltransferase [Thermoprotei archaeon]|nr:hypothetical protein [TACK group archaeon]